MHVIPIASGKGGVGKSFLSVNLAIALGEAGKRVVLIDLDLGASNLHVLLGMGGSYMGVGSFLIGKDLVFDDVILKTQYENLFFIPGDAEIPGIANVKTYQKAKLLRNIYMLETDYVILDLGAGSSFNIIDFFLSSGEGIIITVPTLTATLNAYIFLKNALFRIMTSAFRKHPAAGEYIESLKNNGVNFQKLYIPKLLSEIEKIDKEAYESYMQRTENFRPSMVLNMLSDPKESDKINKLRRSCREYLGIDVEHLGVIFRDYIQDVALSSRIPIVSYKPQSVISQAVFRIADKVLQRHDTPQGPLDIESIEETYQVAEIEAEADFEFKLHEIEALLHSGVLSTGDLIETIKNQQFELTSLKKENQLLKSKIVKAIEQGFQV